MPVATHPHMIEVKRSSNITHMGHHEEKLHIKFKDGSHYVYDGVPESKYHQMLAADSVGTFLHENIKGKFPHTKL